MSVLVRSAIGFALVGLMSLVAGLASPSGLHWLQAHGVVLVVGTVLPLLAHWHNITYARFTRAAPENLLNGQARFYMGAALAMFAGTLLQPSNLFTILLMVGFVLLLLAAVWSLRIHMACKPSDSLVNIELDPLTKGDDASFKHLKMCHFFFPLGIVFLMLAFMPGINSSVFGHRFWLAGIHVVLIGYGLLSLYGLGHMWVPRFSTVPAIAAGAIKGELHSTMPAMILLPIGFLGDWVGFVIAGGSFAFLGFFTYMGVLGANIMRNKSVTHRVTPEFVYIPWTFAGIFWLVSGVLMGVILPAVPDVLLDKASSLRSVHVHGNLLGGFIQLLLAWWIPRAAHPTQFSGWMKASFYGFNAGVAVLVANLLGSGSTTGHLVAAILVIGSLAAFFVATGAFKSGSSSQPA